MSVRDYGEGPVNADRGHRLNQLFQVMRRDPSVDAGIAMCRAIVEAFGRPLTTLPADQAGTIMQADLPVLEERQT